MVHGFLAQMSNNDLVQIQKQTLEDVLLGEEPTEEFLEELNVLNEIDEISDDELGELALNSKADSTEAIVKPTDPNYKTNESSFLSIFLAICILSVVIYWLFKILRF